MYKEKEEVLKNAENILNKQEEPWYITVEGDSIIAKWKWMDATFFSINEVTNEEKEYQYIVTLKDNGRWKEAEKVQEKSSNIGASKISFGSSTFIGKSTQKNITINLGKNKETNKVGIVKSKFNTKIIKEAVRQYLVNCGWKKVSIFG